MTSEEKAKKLYEIADALEEWRKCDEKITNAAEWKTEAAKQIIRNAMTLLVNNLWLLNECKDKYGYYNPLEQCFISIDHAASLLGTKDLGVFQSWTRDFTKSHLFGGERRSFADECLRYANRINNETESVTRDGGDVYNIKAEHVSLGDNTKHASRNINTNTSESDGIIGDVWSPCGIPINIKGLRTRLQSHPYWLALCLLVIVLISTSSLWWPFVSGIGNDSSSSKPDVPAEIPAFGEHRKSDLNPRIEKRIDELYSKIDNEKLGPWFKIHSGKPFRVEKQDGTLIQYETKVFEGSPRIVFWSDDFIPPILEDAIETAFDQTIEECRANGKDPKPYLYETNSFLAGLIGKVYNRMAEIDRRLRSKGTLKDIQLKDVNDEMRKMNECLRGHYKAAISLASGNSKAKLKMSTETKPNGNSIEPLNPKELKKESKPPKNNLPDKIEKEEGGIINKNILEVVGFISVLAGALWAFFVLRKLYQLMRPIHIEVDYHLFYDNSVPDEICVTMVNRSSEAQYIVSCVARGTYSFRRIAIAHIRKPFLHSTLYHNIRFGAVTYPLLREDSLKIEPSEPVKFQHKMSGHPFGKMLTPFFLIEARLSSGRMIRSKKIRVPQRWRLIVPS